MKGTRLWNQPRSPLIHGRSRRERPFVADWLVGALLGAVAGALVVGVLLAPEGASVAEAMMSLAVPVVAGAALGSAAGVPLAGGFGWHPRWVAAALLGAALSVLCAWVVLLV